MGQKLLVLLLFIIYLATGKSFPHLQQWLIIWENQTSVPSVHMQPDVHSALLAAIKQLSRTHWQIKSPNGAASALKCHFCEVANSYEGCIWGRGVCIAGTNETCQIRVAKFVPIFYMTWLGCAHQSHNCNKSGLSDSFFGFSYDVKCCDSDLCNMIPPLHHRWPWNGADCHMLPNFGGLLLGALLHWIFLM